MSHWWRAHDDAVDNAKLCLISDRAHRAWFNLCCLTSANGGNLPDMAVIVLKLRMSKSRAEAVLDELKKAGLIDEDETGMRPHDWNGRQFKSDVSTDRVKQFRKRQRNVSSAVSETPPDNRVQNTEAEKEEEPRASALPPADDWPSDYRARFWARYPNKVGKPDALKKLDRARKSGVPWLELWGGLERYVGKTDDRPWCNPATWIHQQRWTDQPANGTRNGSGRQSQADLSVPAAGDRILDRYWELDAPQQAYQPAHGDPAGETHGRLLSEVRRSGPGDLPAGVVGGPGRVPA